MLDIAVIAVASWVAEVSCIRLYGFYEYDAPWTLFVDVMPVLVALIWPFVILSARELRERAKLPAAAVLVIVLYDAALIEPVAVRAGLWSWNEPGLFGVPVIGILGWGFFAATVSFLFDRLHGAKRWLAVILAPAATHVFLLAVWWGGLRWILRAEISATVAAVVALGVALMLGLTVRRKKLQVGLDAMAPRMAAAGLFFALLFWRGTDTAPLMVYGLTFAVPYVLATRWRAAKV